MSLFSSHNPATGDVVWTGPAAAAADVDSAISRTRAASSAWEKRPLADRAAVLSAFAKRLEADRGAFARAISLETGKPRWEALTEVGSMVAKVAISIEAHAARCADFGTGQAVTRFRPHGVVAVLGPFNFPGHLPNGHIVPALLAGNTVVFKPSELAPLVAERTAAAWTAAGLPGGVLEIVQGGRETGEAVASHRGIDGLFFTGSARAGLELSRAFAATPERILALEMGGNNPLLVHHASDAEAAALLTIQSAYLSAGQRCTCARRLIIPEGVEGDRFIETLMRLTAQIRVGGPDVVPEPFMGPVITPAAANRLVEAHANLLARGARSLLPLQTLREGTGLVTPGLIDVTPVEERTDEELFGPLLQLIRVPDFEAGLREANRTAYGLAAGLVSDDAALYEIFRRTIRAGIVNWNQPLTGASSRAAFGGIGRSGNHRPSAWLAADYCSYPVASIEEPVLKRPPSLPPGLASLS